MSYTFSADIYFHHFQVSDTPTPLRHWQGLTFLLNTEALWQVFFITLGSWTSLIIDNLIINAYHGVFPKKQMKIHLHCVCCCRLFMNYLKPTHGLQVKFHPVIFLFLGNSILTDFCNVTLCNKMQHFCRCNVFVHQPSFSFFWYIYVTLYSLKTCL